MAKYKFKEFNLIMVDPVVELHGSVGTVINNGVPELYTFAELILKCGGVEKMYKLEASTVPESWSIDDLQKWVMNELERFRID